MYVCMYVCNVALRKPQGLSCHKKQANQRKLIDRTNISFCCSH